MDLKLTCSSPDKMTDTNKLLYGIFVLLSEMAEGKSKAAIGSLASETDGGNTNNRQENKNSSTQATEPDTVKEGRNCKYCDEFIEGNQGTYLAHVRKCPKRK